MSLFIHERGGGSSLGRGKGSFRSCQTPAARDHSLSLSLDSLFSSRDKTVRHGLYEIVRCAFVSTRTTLTSNHFYFFFPFLFLKYFIYFLSRLKPKSKQQFLWAPLSWLLDAVNCEGLLQCQAPFTNRFQYLTVDDVIFCQPILVTEYHVYMSGIVPFDSSYPVAHSKYYSFFFL